MCPFRFLARFILFCCILASHTASSWTTTTTDPPTISRRRLLLVDTRNAAAVIATSWCVGLSPCLANDNDSAVEECDEACREKRLQIIRERRAMMQQSRSTSSRQEVFDLSRQRATLYNTTYQGAACPPGIPCL